MYLYNTCLLYVCIMYHRLLQRFILPCVRPKFIFKPDYNLVGDGCDYPAGGDPLPQAGGQQRGGGRHPAQGAAARDH